VVKGLVALVNGPIWAPYTFMSGQRLTWREIVDTIRRERPKFTVQVSTLNEVIDTLMPGNSADNITFAQLQLYSASGAARCPEGEVEKQKQEYFRDIHFHTLQEIWNQFNDNKTIIF
jgi:hypothetical protein